MKLVTLTFLLMAALLAPACASQPSAPNSTAIPTPTLIPTFRFVAPTEAPQIATAAAQATAASTGAGANAERVARGKDRYAALDCGNCHGANAEGGSALALTNLTMSQDEFISLMRSGGKMGSQHQYASNRLSQSGGENLYLYLQSLKSSS
jgi:mono/diheme cytochrome c family protein